MAKQFDPLEPLPDHLADTGPIRRVETVSGWRRAVGFVSLIGAAALTLATVLLLTSSPNPEPQPQPDAATFAPTTPADVPLQATAQPTSTPTIEAIPSTLSADAISVLLSTPLAPVAPSSKLAIERNDYNPFTIIPARPRSEVIQYQVVSGDTIFAIAQRYGLKPESIAWANDRAIVEGLRPGKYLNILPVDGAYYTVTAETTISSIAKNYHVDPYTIIDSEYNDLFGDTPDTELPSGTRVVVPGGTAEQIAWTPKVERVAAGSGAGSSGVGRISFDPGDPGSCGLVDNPGGGGGWVKPLASYVWVRGFSGIHSGVDLSAPPGTPVMAANGGTVIFAGWSNWGYGYSIVLAHGPYTTLYGHLSGINVGCAQRVSAGQVIGAVGSSGDSTGPHLHFEIRYNDIPTDPTGTMPF
jgi:murein DD-endopeptidase MepM/ murein hydrolase activator NlpD